MSAVGDYVMWAREAKRLHDEELRLSRVWDATLKAAHDADRQAKMMLILAVRSLYEQGLSRAKAANVLGVSEASIDDEWFRAKCANNAVGGVEKKDRNKEIAERIAAGEKPKSLAEEYGVSAPRIRQIAMKAGAL